MLQPSPSNTNRKALLAVIGLVVVLAGYTLTRGADSKTPAVGGAAPDFTLTSQDGTPGNLHDFRGKWVVLYFYPKDFTSGCTNEAHNLKRALAHFAQAVLRERRAQLQAACRYEQKSERRVRLGNEFWRCEAFRAAHLPDQSRWSNRQG